MEGKQTCKFIEASGLIKTGAGYIDTVHVEVGNTGDIVSIYDNTAASGVPIFKTAVQSFVASTVQVFTFNIHAHVKTGIYVVFTGGAGQIDYLNITYR